MTAATATLGPMAALAQAVATAPHGRWRQVTYPRAAATARPETPAAVAAAAERPAVSRCATARGRRPSTLTLAVAAVAVARAVAAARAAKAAAEHLQKHLMAVEHSSVL